MIILTVLAICAWVLTGLQLNWGVVVLKSALKTLGLRKSKSAKEEKPRSKEEVEELKTDESLLDRTTASKESFVEKFKHAAEHLEVADTVDDATDPLEGVPGPAIM